MGKVRYIGSKARVVEQIMDLAGVPQEGRFVDVFSGTGIVSHEAAKRGWSIRANDHLLSACVATTAQVLAASDVGFRQLGGYEEATIRLNQVPPIAGAVFREYTPSGRSHSGHLRQYFTCENGARIDGMRAAVESWWQAGKLSDNERTLLIADLLESANTVANIAGTYGCFLSRWTQSALREIVVSPRQLLAKPVQFEVSGSDAFELNPRHNDVVYMDPPYTKRQYAAYYHLLETIVAGDAPAVEGVSGIRPWQDKASPFCYKRLALDALLSLCENFSAKRILISYSCGGHISLDRIRDELGRCGKVEVHELALVGRYRPNQIATGNGSSVTEYLFELRKQRSASNPTRSLFASFSPRSLRAQAAGVHT